MSTQSDQIDDLELDEALRRLDPAVPRSLVLLDRLVDLTESAVRPRRFKRRWRIVLASSIGAVVLAASLIAAANGAGVLFPLGPLAPGERWSTAYIVYHPPAAAHEFAQCEIRPTLANLSDAQFQAIENKINDGSWGDLSQDVAAREPAYAGQRGAYDLALTDAIFARLQSVVPTLSYPTYPQQSGPRMTGLIEACGG